MSITGDDKTPAPPADAGKVSPDARPDAALAPPETPEADHGAGGDPLIEGP